MKLLIFKTPDLLEKERQIGAAINHLLELQTTLERYKLIELHLIPIKKTIDDVINNLKCNNYE